MRVTASQRLIVVVVIFSVTHFFCLLINLYFVIVIFEIRKGFYTSFVSFMNKEPRLRGTAVNNTCNPQNLPLSTFSYFLTVPVTHNSKFFCKNETKTHFLNFNALIQRIKVILKIPLTVTRNTCPGTP